MRIERVVKDAEDGAEAIAIVRKEMRKEAADKIDAERLVAELDGAKWEAAYSDAKGGWLVALSVRASPPAPEITPDIPPEQPRT